jgi:N-acetylglutamate synthase-like GNAT family acetyltransferase
MFMISRARHEDIADIQRLHQELRRPLRQQFEMEEYLVARVEGRLIGCAAVHLISSAKEGEGYLYGLGVHKEFQRRGIGRALTEARIDLVRSFGGSQATALAMFWNVTFFRRLGFVTIPRDSPSTDMRKLSDFCDTRYRRSAVMLRKVTL